MNVLKYNHLDFPFYRVVANYLNCDNLHFLHLQDPTQFTADIPGKDNGTVWHKKFYEMFKKDTWFYTIYYSFLKEVIGLNENFLFQAIPTFRIQLPSCKAVGGKSHRDGDYNHPDGEINFLVPLTYMAGSSSIFTESKPGMKDYQFISLNLGDYLKFDGRNCEHGNAQNSTGLTRVSFDFRILPLNDYHPEKAKSSVGIGAKFIDGEYYSRF